MLLDVGDRKYAVHFSHRRDFEVDASRVDSDGDSIVVAHWTTYCQVHEGICKVKGCADAEHPYFGAAHCNPQDQFSKSAGRKISLGRALQPLPRSLREQIWIAYFKVSPHK